MPRLIDAEKLEEYKASGVSELTEWQQGWNDALDFVINEVPTVDAEPVRHGHWDTKYLSEDEDWSGIEHTIGRCSVCRGKIDIVGKRIPYLYCPFCGAKMDEVEDE